MVHPMARPVAYTMENGSSGALMTPPMIYNMGYAMVVTVRSTTGQLVPWSIRWASVIALNGLE